MSKSIKIKIVKPRGQKRYCMHVTFGATEFYLSLGDALALSAMIKNRMPALIDKYKEGKK